MSNIKKALNSDLFKEAMSGVVAAGNKDFESYMFDINSIKTEFTFVINFDDYIKIYNDALLSYRMGKLTFPELNYIYKSLSVFLDELLE